MQSAFRGYEDFLVSYSYITLKKMSKNFKAFILLNNAMPLCVFLVSFNFILFNLFCFIFCSSPEWSKINKSEWEKMGLKFEQEGEFW